MIVERSSKPVGLYAKVLSLNLGLRTTGLLFVTRAQQHREVSQIILQYFVIVFSSLIFKNMSRTKQDLHIIAFQLPFNCLSIAFQLPFNCLSIAFQLPFNCLSIAFDKRSNKCKKSIGRSCCNDLCHNYQTSEALLLQTTITFSGAHLFHELCSVGTK